MSVRSCGCRAEGLSDRAIARSRGLARSTVSDYAGRAVRGRAELAVAGRADRRGAGGAAVLRRGPAAGARRKPEPDWAGLHRELRRPGVTLMLLWEEYRAGAPDGFGY